MAVTSEQIRAAFAGRQHPPRNTGFLQRTDTGSLDTLRRRVRAGLLELVGVAAHESRLDIDVAGQCERVGPATDVVVAGFETIHLGSPRQVAEDLIRACRPGGRIGIVCPVPGSFLAEVHERIAMYATSGAEGPRPGFTGTREALDKLFGDSAIALGARDQSVSFVISSAEHWLAEWRRSYAPLKRAYEQVAPAWRDQLTNDLLDIAALYAVHGDGEISIRCDYLEFVVHKGAAQ